MSIRQLSGMRTTVRLEETLLKRAKQRAAAEGRTLTSLIEEGLELALARPKTRPRRRVAIPVARETGGVWPGVNLNNSAMLADRMGCSWRTGVPDLLRS
jgi:hypothetical protein